MQFRPGHGELLRWVDKEGVPLLMFSAGIAGKQGQTAGGWGMGWWEDRQNVLRIWVDVRKLCDPFFFFLYETGFVFFKKAAAVL